MQGNSVKKVVYLVDHRVRDLMGSALVAHHLSKRGIECFLEPLEAYRGCLAAHRPDAIIFNHLFTEHLVAYSRRLQSMGVKVVLLLNEGLVQTPEYLEFASGKYYHPHVDLFMCWNQAHGNALRSSPHFRSTRIEMTGTPRFDYYFPPYRDIYASPFPPATNPGIKTALLCTNFGFAPYHDWPKRHLSFADAWAKRLPSYKMADTAARAAMHHASRERFFVFLDQLIKRPDYRLVIRPHPRETHARYLAWIEALDQSARQRVIFSPGAEIAALINHCDVLVSCDTCTTALEAWISGKPTLALQTASETVMVNLQQWALSDTCAEPADFPDRLDAAIATPVDAGLHESRMAFVETRCGRVDGQAAHRVAAGIGELLQGSPSPAWGKLAVADRRRGYKLLTLRQFSLPYNFDPLMVAKRRVAAGRYATKIAAYDKAITVSDVSRARKIIADALDGSGQPATDGKIKA